MCNIFNDLRLEDEHCDVVIKVDATEFSAHKIILCGCSDYFRRLFSSVWSPSGKHVYNIPGISAEMMGLIIEHRFLEDQLCVENCIDIWGFAEFYSCLQLQQNAYLFILRHFEEIARTSEEFLDLSLRQLSSIIEKTT
ncbi:hypothetical protein SRHO_G00328930 [Serrasalmus rhombeus]